MSTVPIKKTKKIAEKPKKMYINTLEPYFGLKNKKGKIINPLNCCIPI